MVAILKEDSLPPVAALRDMMRKTRNHDPRQTCHAATIALRMGNRYHVPLFPRFPRERLAA